MVPLLVQLPFTTAFTAAGHAGHTKGCRRSGNVDAGAGFGEDDHDRQEREPSHCHRITVA